MSDFEKYSGLIKQHYQLTKESYGFDLAIPSSAKLRDLALHIYDNGLPKNDEIIFRLFFEIKNDEDFRRGIQQVDLDKFKAVSNFLKGKSERTNSNILNLIAILLDFQPRPFAAFRIKKSDWFSIKKVNNFENEGYVKSTQINQNTIKIGFAILVFLVLGFTTKMIFFPEEQCMQWQKDHYVLVDCQNEAVGFGNFNEVKPASENELTLQKITPNENTVYFKNDKPLIWYVKINDSTIECFNQQGFHPELGKPLKPISKYMINKYLVKNGQ